MKKKKIYPKLMCFLAGIILCGGCNSMLQREQAAIDRLGAPSLVKISSGDAVLYDTHISQDFLMYKKTWSNT